MKNIVILSFLFLSISSCTRESKVSTITIKLPPAEKAAVDTVDLKAGGFNNTLNPSTIADINCYGIFVGGPEGVMQQSNCSDSATGTVKMTFWPHKYFMQAGSQVSIDVPSGPARKIYLVGLKAQNNSCQIISPGQNLDGNNLSVPQIISEQVVDLAPGEKTIQMVRTLDSTKKFDTCNFAGGGGNGSPALFGNGRDGNLTVTGPAFLVFGTDNFAADMDASHSLSSLPSPAIKKISSSARVSNIDNVTGKTLTLDTTITSMDFEPGDEVLWHVSSAWAATNPDYEGCGTGTSFFRGQYGFAHIASVPDSTHVVLNSPITTNPTAINNANLAQSNPQANTPFCRIHITRVPNFNIINLSSSQSLNLSPTAFNYTSGGIIAFRVNEIVLNSGAVFNINADGKGFGSAVTYQGDGVQGKGNSGGSDYVANQNGGGLGISSNSGGGGGGSANGGNGGGGTPGQYGNGITFCGAAPCLGTRDKKIFMGGGGGSASTTGGTGGGFILILARKISGTGSLVLNANGTNGSSGSAGAGGGGGGSISLNAKEISSGVTITTFTNGGNGGTGTTSGGGGGGGSAEIRYCATLTSTLNATLTASGGSGYVAGTAAPATAQLVTDVPGLCTTN